MTDMPCIQTQVKEVENDQYQIDRLEIFRLEAKLQELWDKIKESQEDIGRQEQAKAELETKQQTVQGQYEEVLWDRQQRVFCVGTEARKCE